VQLLSLCAYLAPEPIPLDLFTDHPEQLPAPLDHVAGDPLAFAETVGALIDYSLARRTDAGLLLHRLVQAVIRQSGPNQPQDSHPLPVVLGLLRADLPEEIMAAPQNWLRWRQLLPHVLTATAHHDDANPTAANATSWLLDAPPPTSKPTVNRPSPDPCWSGRCSSTRSPMGPTTPFSRHHRIRPAPATSLSR
jgi:hypothetical protein